ncbi:MAG: peptidylprolyl isomerase [Cyanobacteria bacterium Co-bin8]|nr:peptidylprolyl isomerase [Cyanobacteria bacterium Co-bin8]
MSKPPFMFIDDEAISPEQVCEYLQNAGQLETFIEEILGQHAIAKEIQSHPELAPPDEAAEQLLQEFRQSRNLDDDEVFDAWLQQNALDDATLADTLLEQLTLEQLLQHICQPQLQEYFIKRKQQLDQVELSCIVVQEEHLAKELHEQITQENVAFEQMAQQYSLADNRYSGGKIPPVARESLSEDLRTELDALYPGEVVGPLPIEGRWCLFRLEAVLPAALEGETEIQLQSELFQQWLRDRTDAMTVKLEVMQWWYL